MEPKQKNILIIDPDLPTGAKLQKALEERGHAVIVSKNGGELFNKTKRIPVPDLVITEILELRPGMDTFRLITTLKSSEKTKTTKIIVCSENPKDTEVAKAKSSGADVFINKPFSPKEVIDRIGRLLEGTLPGPQKQDEKTPSADANRQAWVDFRREVARVDADSRRHPRLEFHCPIRIEGYKGVHKVTDISLGGVFVECEDPEVFKLGETRKLVIKVPTEYDPIKIKAEVANVRKRGVGFKYIDLNAKSQEMIRFCFDTFKDTIPLR